MKWANFLCKKRMRSAFWWNRLQKIDVLKLLFFPLLLYVLFFLRITSIDIFCKNCSHPENQSLIAKSLSYNEFIGSFTNFETTNLRIFDTKMNVVQKIRETIWWIYYYMIFTAAFHDDHSMIWRDFSKFRIHLYILCSLKL